MTVQFDVDIRKTLRAGPREFHLCLRLHTDSQRIVIFGPSGAGKTLTLKLLAGLERQDAGHVRVGGETLFDADAGIDLSVQARRMAFVFQDYALFPHLDVRQNVGFPLRRGWLNPRRTRRDPVVEHWLETLGLAEVAHQYPDQISGGQRQRTALARALVMQPRALLLDEPFAALDPELRAHLRNEFDCLQRRLQVPMLLISHDPVDAEVFGDHVVRLRSGVLVPEDATVAAAT